MEVPLEGEPVRIIAVVLKYLFNRIQVYLLSVGEAAPISWKEDFVRSVVLLSYSGSVHVDNAG